LNLRLLEVRGVVCRRLVGSQVACDLVPVHASFDVLVELLAGVVGAL